MLLLLLVAACHRSGIWLAGGGLADDDNSTSEPTPTPVDCSALNPLPVSVQTIYGPVSQEDFAFDIEGNLVSADMQGNLVRSTYDGQVSVWVPSVADSTAGMSFLPDGDLVFAADWAGTLYRVKANGSVLPLVSGLSYPNGVEVHKDGWIFVSEHDAGNIRRVDPDTGEFQVVAQGLYNPNGITFSPDYHYLYVGSFGGGTVHALELDDQAMPVGEPVLLFEVNSGGMEGGGLDGIGVDACGNVYVTEYILGKVWRYSIDTEQVELAAQLPAYWIPNVDFGSGVGGWDRTKLYVIDREDPKVYELDIGIPGRPKAYEP